MLGRAAWLDAVTGSVSSVEAGLFRTVFAEAPVGFLIRSLDGRTLLANPAAAHMLGYPADELLRIGLSDLVHPDDAAVELAALARFHAGRVDRAAASEQRYVRKDGDVLWARVVSTRVAATEATPAYLVSLLVDLSDLPQSEGAHEDSARAVVRTGAWRTYTGSLAGGIAHDVNNILTVINGYAEQMSRRVVPGTELAAAVDEILDAGHRASTLIEQLLAVSRRTAPRLMAVDVARALDELDGMLRRVVPESIELVVAVDPAAGQVRLARGQLEQIVLNLVVNSVDAMPDGGRLTISARAGTARAERADGDAAHPKRFVELTVEDTGVGMAPEVLARMFEPFFTTKPRGRGTGLGLSTVHGIVTQCGGHVHPDSGPGRGCRIRVSIPGDASAP